MVVVWLFLGVPRVCLQFVIVLSPDHTHLLYFIAKLLKLFCILCHLEILHASAVTFYFRDEFMIII